MPEATGPGAGRSRQRREHLNPSERGVSVVVPTWREADNLAALAERVAGALESRPGPWELLLVDDDSQDGSEEIAADLARRLPLRLILRRDGPRDLSLAVLEGIRRARYDRVVVLDADLSHPPESIPALLTALDRGASDLVVGSRYAPGSVIAPTWSRARFFLSRLATLLARPLARCSDPLSGFFAADRCSLPELDPRRPLGYKIALEFMVRGRLRVGEVPIAFADRTRGSSKMTRRQQTAYLSQLGRLYLHRLRAAARRRR